VFVVFRIRNAQHTQHTVTVGCMGLPYYSTLSPKNGTLFGKATEHTMCALIFPTSFVLNTSHCKKNLER